MSMTDENAAYQEGKAEFLRQAAAAYDRMMSSDQER